MIKRNISWVRKPWILIGILLTLTAMLLIACGPSTIDQAATALPVTESPQEVGYPGQSSPVESANEEAYPGQSSPPASANEEAYPVEALPVPSPTLPAGGYPSSGLDEFKEPRFRFDLPIKTGDTLITGQAPPNIPLAIVDVTYNGLVLGSGVSDDAGLFSIGVQGLPDGHRIGITFAELEPGKTIAEMSEEYFPYRGDGFMNLPNVGILFDTILIEP